MSDFNAEVANDIKIIADTITVQVFSTFYHYFLSTNNSYIEKYHDLLAILRRKGDRVDDLVLDALSGVINTVSLEDIEGCLNSAFIQIPASMMEEDELLPVEEEFFRGCTSGFRNLYLRENFPKKDVHELQGRLYEFSRLINPTLSEMEWILDEKERFITRKAAAVIGGFHARDNRNNELFDLMFRYCICWHNLIDILRSHAGELYQIYHEFFGKGLFNKYSRFYNDVKTAESEIADRFIKEFLETEIRAFENEFDSRVDPVNSDSINPDDSPTLRNVCSRVEVFFESGTDSKFY